MRKSTVLICGLAVAVVGGCQSGGGAGGGGDGLVSRTQELSRDVCLFEPDAGPIEAILALDNPDLRTAPAVARAVCEAVAQYKPMGGGPLPAGSPAQVAGVPVTGSFLKR